MTKTSKLMLATYNTQVFKFTRKVKSTKLIVRNANAIRNNS